MYMLNNKTRDAIKAKFKPKYNKFKNVEGANVHDLSLHEDIGDLDKNDILDDNISQPVDIYEIIKDRPYNYQAYASLNPGTPHLEKDEIIDVCIFSINNLNVLPYIQVCLYRNENVLTWNTHKCSGENDINKVLTQLKTELNDGDLSYKGFYKHF